MSASPQRLVAALDLGSSRIAAVIAEATGDARTTGARILGVGHEKSAGIRRGVVRDMEDATGAITRALK
ncbi:MAG: cell division protein FtsA, partial [Gemmatimonadales bacterium]